MFVGPAGGRPPRTYTRKNGCFPLWTYSRTSVPDEERLDIRSSVLLLLYDYMHRRKPDAGSRGATDDYVRSRVLWRMWHYERSGDDVSVDVFPAITYDRRGKEFRKVSFLWRLFRYERAGRARKVDVLFIPVLRSGEDKS